MSMFFILSALTFSLLPSCYTATILEEVGFDTLQSWVQGLDSDLDQEFQQLQMSHTKRTTTDYGALQDSVSRSFASLEGFERSKTLMTNHESFALFNNQKQAQMQERYCQYVQSDGCLASERAKRCICGESGDVFVSCMALLEEEAITYANNRRRARRLGRTATATNLRSGSFSNHSNNRQLRKCDIIVEGDDGEVVTAEDIIGGEIGDVFDFFTSLADQSLLEIEGGTLGVACSIPLTPLPLEATFYVEAESPGIGLGDLLGGLSREKAKDISISVDAKLCVLSADEIQDNPALEEIVSIMEFFGLDLCPIELAGSLFPLLGSFQAQIRAKLLFFYARGSLQWLFSDKIRSVMGDRCDGVDCLDPENRDCAMCEGDLFADGILGVNLLFHEITSPLFESNVVESCAREDETSDQCVNGLATKAPGENCLFDSDCGQQGGHCHLFKCRPHGEIFDSCGKDSDCQGALTCFGFGTHKTCAPKLAEGSFCGADADCLGYCHNLKCYDGSEGDACGKDSDCKSGLTCFALAAGKTCKKGEGALCGEDTDCLG